MIRIASPRHRSSPAVSASWWPWLRDRLTATSRGSLRRQSLHHRPAAVARPVVDQHDLIILARRLRARLRSAARAASARHASSLKQGTTIDSAVMGAPDRGSNPVRARPAASRRPARGRYGGGSISQTIVEVARAASARSDWSIVQMQAVAAADRAARSATGRRRNSPASRYLRVSRLTPSIIHWSLEKPSRRTITIAPRWLLRGSGQPCRTACRPGVHDARADRHVIERGELRLLVVRRPSPG